MSMHYDCAKFKGLKIGEGVALTSFDLCEADGKLETYAAQRAKAKGQSGDVYAELIRASITHVNGAPVSQPYEAFDEWNARARAFLIAAWRTLNSVDDDEIKDFLAGATDTAGA
jgi:hypothetical protein